VLIGKRAISGWKLVIESVPHHCTARVDSVFKAEIGYQSQCFSLAQIFRFGGDAAAILTYKFSIANKLFIFLKMMFNKPDIMSHTQVCFMPGMGLCNF
jgi:hypothetical protein